MKKKHEGITKAICNNGFSDNSSILPRIKFRVDGQESISQFLTAYSLNRYFKNENDCYRYIAQVKWNGKNFECRKCGNAN